MRNIILLLLDNLSIIKWDITYIIYYLFFNEFRRNFKKLKKLKNIHYKKRCFIVGNGPSLQKMDLSHLNKEITITVNDIMYNREIYENLYTDFHVFIDPYYLNLDSDNLNDLHKIQVLESINYISKKPICFTNWIGYSSFKKNGLNEKLDLHYLFQNRTIINSKFRNIDFSKNTYNAQNVIHTAIYAAIYMGFKEIYLIGCDMTNIFFRFNADQNGEHKVNNTYAYRFSEEETSRLEVVAKKRDNEDLLSDFAKTFRIFKWINHYCNIKGIKIFNATIGGGLDMFERIDYKSIFSK